MRNDVCLTVFYSAVQLTVPVTTNVDKTKFCSQIVRLARISETVQDRTKVAIYIFTQSTIKAKIK